MRRYLWLAIAPLIVAAPVCAQAKRDIRAEDVKQSIDKGVKYLKQVQRANGSWEVDGDVISNATVSHPGGKTALALLALLNSGLTPKDATVSLGLKHLRNVVPESTYVCA